MLKAIQDTTEHPTSFNVVGHYILQNFWEYYVIEKPDENGNIFAYVMGDYDEFGYVSLEELKPYIIQSLNEEELSSNPESPNYLAPPTGYRWKD